LNWEGGDAKVVSGVGRGVVVVALVRRARWLCSRLSVSVTADRVGCGVAAVASSPKSNQPASRFAILSQTQSLPPRRV
jgi:hypothetical protein